MATPVTVIVPIKLKSGKSEADLLAASDRFQTEFVNHQAGVVRRELVQKSAAEYLDIVQFRSVKDAEDIVEKEKESAACHAFFSVMDMGDMEDSELDFYPSLATYD